MLGFFAFFAKNYFFTMFLGMLFYIYVYRSYRFKEYRKYLLDWKFLVFLSVLGSLILHSSWYSFDLIESGAPQTEYLVGFYIYSRAVTAFYGGFWMLSIFVFVYIEYILPHLKIEEESEPEPVKEPEETIEERLKRLKEESKK